MNSNCTRCGARLKDGDVYCKECGAPTGNDPAYGSSWSDESGQSQYDYGSQPAYDQSDLYSAYDPTMVYDPSASSSYDDGSYRDYSQGYGYTQDPNGYAYDQGYGYQDQTGASYNQGYDQYYGYGYTQNYAPQPIYVPDGQGGMVAPNTRNYPGGGPRKGRVGFILLAIVLAVVVLATLFILFSTPLINWNQATSEVAEESMIIADDTLAHDEQIPATPTPQEAVSPLEQAVRDGNAIFYRAFGDNTFTVLSIQNNTWILQRGQAWALQPGQFDGSQVPTAEGVELGLVSSGRVDSPTSFSDSNVVFKVSYTDDSMTISANSKAPADTLTLAGSYYTNPSEAIYHQSPGTAPAANPNATLPETQPTAGDFILPESNTTQVSAEALEPLSDQDLYYARNEIYARHGRPFANDELQQYFNSKSWYHASTLTPSEWDDQFSGLNDAEKYNLELIRSIEAQRGSAYI